MSKCPRCNEADPNFCPFHTRVDQAARARDQQFLQDMATMIMGELDLTWRMDMGNAEVVVANNMKAALLQQMTLADVLNKNALDLDGLHHSPEQERLDHDLAEMRELAAQEYATHLASEQTDSPVDTPE